MAVTTADINSLTSSIDNLIKSMTNQSRFSTGPQGAGGDNASRLLARREKHNVKLYENIVKSTRNSAHALKEIKKLTDKETKLSLKVIHANTQLEKVMEKSYEDGKAGRRVLERLPKNFRDALETLDKDEKDPGINFGNISKTIEDTFDIQNSMDTLKSIIDEMKLKGKDTKYKETFSDVNKIGELVNSVTESSTAMQQASKANIDGVVDSVTESSTAMQQAAKANVDGLIDTSMTMQQALKQKEKDNKENISSFGEKLINVSESMDQALKQKEKDNKENISSFGESVDDATEKLDENQKAAKIHYELIGKHLKTLGINFDEIIKTSKSYEEVIERLEKAQKKVIEATNKAAKSSGGGMGNLLGGSKKLIGKMIGGILGIVGSYVVQKGIQFAKDFADEIGTQMKFGYSIPMKEFPDIALKFGMNIKEASEFLGKQRDVMNARNLGEKEYMGILEDGSKTLMNYTGSLAESTKAYANTIRDTRRFGVATIDSAAAAKRQTDLYKESFAPLGVLPDAYEDLRESVLSNEGNMVTLGALQRDQREEFILGIQKQHEYYLALGFNIDQTKRATGVLSALSKQSPLERMKKGAALGAMMGMAGMGAQGARMQDYMKRFHTLDKAEKKDLYEMKTEVANRFTQMYGEQQGGIMFEQMAHQYGFADEFATLESWTKEGMAADKDRAKTEVGRHKENTEKFTEMIGAMNSIKAASESSVGLLGMIAIKAATEFAPEMVGDIEKFAGDIIFKANKGLGTALGGLIGTPQSKIQTEININKSKRDKLRGQITGYGEQLISGEQKYNKRAIETGNEIASAKGYRRKLLVKGLEGQHEAYQKDKETLEAQIQETLEKLDKNQKKANELQQKANELQKKGNKAADDTAKHTGESADAEKEKKRKEQDWSKMYQMKISRVSSSPTN